MKRLALALLIVLLALLCGCSWLLPTQYTQITPHSAAQPAPQDTDIPVVSDYAALYRAIQSFAENGVAHGVIRASSYTGSVEEDLARAAYSVAREDPVGAYAIDYLTHDCALIVSYYEITVDITFRDMAADPASLEYVSNQKEVETLLSAAMEDYQDYLTFYAVNAKSYNYDALARQICQSQPTHYMAVPELHVSNYPDDGRSRIVELTLDWPAEASLLKKMEQAVTESLQAASVYVRYRTTDWEKLNLLYTYLMERFSYVEYQTDTPIYSALCEGFLTSESASTLWQLLCDQLGIPCQTVSGSRSGTEYFWNIITLDDTSYHVDLLRDLLEPDSLHLRYDEEMSGYSWDTELYPLCPQPKPEITPEPETQPAPETPSPEEPDPSQQSPQETEDGELEEEEKRELNFTRRA